MSSILPATQERMSPKVFSEITAFAYEKFGLDLGQGKEALVEARLRKLLRRTGCPSFEELVKRLKDPRNTVEMAELENLLTTHHTHFMREPAHFDFLNTKVFPALLTKSRNIELWCAASSTGEEAYSLLMSMHTALGPQAVSKINILATDISVGVLEIASRGVYGQDRIDKLPSGWLQKFFLRGHGQQHGYFRVKPELMSRVRFSRLNLRDPLPSIGPFSVILCRNVMIYFDRPTQQQVVGRMCTVLETGGHLMVGHAEGLAAVDHSLEYIGPSIYKKK